MVQTYLQEAQSEFKQVKEEELVIEGQRVHAKTILNATSTQPAAQIKFENWTITSITPAPEFSSLASEETLDRIWNDPSEDAAWAGL